MGLTAQHCSRVTQARVGELIATLLAPRRVERRWNWQPALQCVVNLAFDVAVTVESKVPLGPAELIAFTTVKYTNEGLRERVDQWQFLRLQ